MSFLRSRRPSRRLLSTETLETRTVLTATAPVEYEPLDSFESADELRDYLLAQYRDTFEDITERGYCFHGHHYLIDTAFNELAAPASLRLSADVAAPAHSDTNVQIAGVDEADLVETDGQYIYSLSGDSLVIVDSWLLDELRVVSRTELGGQAHAMFLHGDRLTVIASEMGNADFDFEPNESQVPGFDVITFDITDRAAPTMISSTGIEGTYRNARMIDGEVYVQSSHLARMPQPEYELAGGSDDSGLTIFELGQRRIAEGDLLYWPVNCEERDYETWDEYVERVSDDLLEQMLPNFQSLDASGTVVDEGLANAPIDVHLGDSIGGIYNRTGMTLLTVIDAAAETPSMQNSSAVFANDHSIMFATGESIAFVTDGNQASSSLYKIDLADEAAPQWSAHGELNGNVYDQFSIDIHDDYLRVATSWWRGESNLYVFEQQGDSLEIVGSLEDFAPGESVFGVRFQGDRAYAITANVFYDPLFSFDLSDPANPVISDHLEMPGMSRYLHAANSDLLIGVGVDNGRIFDASPRLSLFNTSDPSDLSIADELVLTPSFLADFYEQHGADAPQNFVDADFDTDHHAFNYDAESGLLTIPLVKQHWAHRSDADLLVFKIDTTAGTIDPLGVIQHDASIERSVFIDGKIYSISAETLKVHHPEAIDEAIASLNFRTDPVDVNQDGVVAISDMLTIVAELRHMRIEGEGASLRSALNRPAFDVDSDGSVTVGDALYIANTIRERLPRPGVIFTLGPRPTITLPFDSRNLIEIRTTEIRPDMLRFATPFQVDLAIDVALDALLAESQ